jgi:hypothetical protein
MKTPADRVVERIIQDHRSARHSDIICNHFILDLLKECPPLAEDVNDGKVKWELNAE